MGSGAPLTDQRGFTLLELIVTLLVVSLAVGLAIPAIGRSTEAIRIRADVAGFSAMLRHARERAIVTRKAQAIIVDADGHQITRRVGGPDGEIRENRALSDRLTIAAEPPPATTVRFDPAGGSTGADFRISSGTITYRVTVDALTGRVKSERL